jgi:signal transduction histidine kinase
MIATPSTTAVPSRFRRSLGTGPAAVGLVLAIVAVVSLNTTAKFLATEPFAAWLDYFLGDVVFHSIIAFAVLGAAMWARSRVPTPGWRRYALAALAVVVVTAVCVVAIEATHEDNLFGATDVGWREYLMFLGTDVFRYSFVGTVITSAWLYLCAETEHAAAAEQVAIDAARMDRETAEARLQMLEAQIEPHFLFNTLAHVRRLYETDRDAGARMLRNLQDYLSIALPRMREGAPTLGRELDHAVAYLDIQTIRMGRRLAYAIDVPRDLRDARLPSLMVLTLVENAVKHGLTPRPDGGRIDIRAALVGDRLRIDVADTGGGFAKSQGGGTGLANIRARLASTYGSAAGLSLALNQPTGVIATLELPFDPVGSAIAPS